MKSEKNSLHKSFLYFLFHLIVRNFWLKFLSLIFALLLFFIVRTDKEYVFERTATLKIVTLPKMTVVGPAQRFLNMNIRLKNSLFTIPPSSTDLTGEIVITSEDPGHINYKITRDNFPRLPQYYNVVIDKPVIDIELDYLLKKEVQVIPTIKGTPDANKVYLGYTINPPTVTISGPKQELSSVESLETLPIPIHRLSYTKTFAAQFDLEGKDNLKVTPDAVQVTVEIGDKKNTK